MHCTPARIYCGVQLIVILLSVALVGLIAPNKYYNIMLTPAVFICHPIPHWSSNFIRQLLALIISADGVDESSAINTIPIRINHPATHAA